MQQLIFVLTILAALCTALLAGNFFALSAYFMPALGGLSTERGIVAMQATLRAIKTLPLLVLFFGTAVLCALAGALALADPRAPGADYSMTGSAIFLLGAFAVTMLRHAPLNRQLLTVSPDSRGAREAWNRFQASWVPWNHLRTAAAFLACACFILALADLGIPFGSH